MPKPEKLPPDIERLAFRNALPLDSGIDFHSHTDRLINGITGLIDVGEKQNGAVADAAKFNSRQGAFTIRRRKLAVSGIIVLATVVAAAWFYSRNSYRVVSGESPHVSPIEETRTANVQPTASATTAPEPTTSPVRSAEIDAAPNTSPLISASPVISPSPAPADTNPDSAQPKTRSVDAQARVSETPVTSPPKTKRLFARA